MDGSKPFAEGSILSVSANSLITNYCRRESKMSMNLHIDGFELWQTPTFITHMCLFYNKKSKSDGGREGVIRRYIFLD